MIMRIKVFTVLALLLAATGTIFGREPATGATRVEPSPIENSRQVVLVITKNWETVPGSLWRFERADEHSPWKRVGGKVRIVVGRNGLGWGKGLNAPTELPGPVKEGDGKSPAGVFQLSSIFGLAETNQAKQFKMPYQPLNSVIECVDDVNSKYYNSVQDSTKVEKVDWTSSEKMEAVGEQYRWGVVVDHNMKPMKPGGGSCIFMHIWKDAKTGTSGCTAMTRKDIEESILPWLDIKAHPVLVQLPESEYNKLHKNWQLPKP